MSRKKNARGKNTRGKNKKTKVDYQEIAVLPKLTPQEEDFCKLVVKNGNPLLSYQLAFGYEFSEDDTKESGKILALKYATEQLRRQPHIYIKIKELREKEGLSLTFTALDYYYELSMIKEMALANKNFHTAFNAINKIAQLTGVDTSAAQTNEIPTSIIITHPKKDSE